MLHRHYSHLTSQAGVLRNAAALVRPAIDHLSVRRVNRHRSILKKNKTEE